MIVDFEDGVDRIDLSFSDAISSSFTLDADDFIGKRSFTGKAGQLHSVSAGKVTLIEGDTDGDKRADLVIRLDGQHALTEASFVLHPENVIMLAERTSLPIGRYDLTAHLASLV